MTRSKASVRMRGLCAAVAMAVAFAGCGGSGGSEEKPTRGSAAVRIVGLQAMAGVTRVTVAATPAGTSVDLTADATAGTYSGTLSLPAGSQTLTARAYAGDTLVAEGSASVTIAGGSAISVTIAVVDVTGPGPGPDHSPVLTSISASPTTVIAGQTSTLRAEARDVDGDAITFTWTAAPSGCGTFAPGSATAATSATTTFTAIAAGACTVTVEAAARGLADTMAIGLTVLLPVNVGGVLVPHPAIGSVEFLSPSTATVLRSAADATVRREWAATVPVSLKVTWDDTPWLARSAATLEDDCGGAVVSTGTAAASETFAWTPKAGPVCTLTARVERQGLVDTLAVAVLVGGPPACAWTEVAAFDLAARPAGAVEKGGALGAQGVGVVGGRTAWVQASDWNILLVPSPLGAGDDLFAVEADAYVPSVDTNGRVLVLQAFGADAWVGGEGAPYGVRALVTEDPGGVAAVTLSTWAAGAFVNRVASSTASALNQWTTIRVEGRQSTQRFKAYRGGAATAAWTGAADLSGGYVSLDSSWQNPGGPTGVAWSNLRILRGAGTCGL